MKKTLMILLVLLLPLIGSAQDRKSDSIQYEMMIKPIRDRQNVIAAAYKNKTIEQRMILNSQFADLTKELIRANTEFYRNHFDSEIGLNAFAFVMGPEADALILHNDFRKFSTKVKSTEEGKRIAKSLTILLKTRVGQKAIDFIQNDAIEQPVRLSDFKGKYVLLDFWASWCGPCRRENPHVVRTYNQFKSKGFTVLSVSLDDQKKPWLDAVEKDDMPWYHVSDLKGWKNEVAKLYGIESIPQNFLVDPKGKIVAKNLRGHALYEAVEKAFSPTNQ